MSRKGNDRDLAFPVAASSTIFAEYLRFFGRQMNANAELARKAAACRNITELTEALSVYWQTGIHDVQHYLAETYSRVGSLAIDAAEVIDQAFEQGKARRHKTTSKKRPAGNRRIASSSKRTKANG